MSETFDDLFRADKSFVVLVGRGSTQQKFKLRFETFVPRSELFRDAHHSKWNKDSRNWTGLDEPVILPNDCPHVFVDYARWVYLGAFPFDVHPQASEDVCSRLVKLYLMADKLGDDKTANVMIDEIFVAGQNGLETYQHEQHLINDVYSSTKPGNHLRALFTDMMVYGGYIDQWPNESPSGYHHEFNQDILTKLMRIKSSNRESTVEQAFDPGVLQTKVHNCAYHIHDDGVDDFNRNPKCIQSPTLGAEEQIEKRKASFR